MTVNFTNTSGQGFINSPSNDCSFIPRTLTTPSEAVSGALGLTFLGIGDNTLGVTKNQTNTLGIDAIVASVQHSTATSSAQVTRKQLTSTPGASYDVNDSDNSGGQKNAFSVFLSGHNVSSPIRAFAVAQGNSTTITWPNTGTVQSGDRVIRYAYCDGVTIQDFTRTFDAPSETQIFKIDGETASGRALVIATHKLMPSNAAPGTATVSVSGSAIDWIAFTVVVATAGASLSSPTPTGTIGTTTTATLGATTDQGTAGSNQLYGVWSTSNGFSGVTAAQVKAGQNAAGSTSGVLNGNSAISTTSPSIAISSLSPNTTYYYALVQENSNGFSNVVTGSFTTSAVTTSFSLGIRDDSNAAVTATSLNWFLTSTWGGTVLASGTTSTDGSGALTVTGLSQAAGSYLLFYKAASDQNLNAMRPITLVV